MLHFVRIDFSGGINVNERSALKECDICHYWYFLDKGLKFQPKVRNRCHDLLMMSLNLSNIAILNVKSDYYCCIISRNRKNKAINLMQNTDLSKKKGEHYKT